MVGTLYLEKRPCNQGGRRGARRRRGPEAMGLTKEMWDAVSKFKRSSVQHENIGSPESRVSIFK